jgi:hypothetical protein
MPSQSGHQTDLDEKFFGLMRAIEKMNSQMRSMIVPKTPLDAGAFLDEWSSGVSTVTITPQIDRPALITNILYAMGTTAAGMSLTIGQASGNSRTIPIANNTTVAIHSLIVAMVIRPGDTITLNAASGSNCFLEIMGRVFSGTDWSQV